ncbi:MAG: GFA family protein [Betaproteobacteria bacterium]
MPATLTGRCLCETVRFTLPDAFTYALNCHCSICRRATGAAFKPFGGIEREKLSIVAGGDRLLKYGGEVDHDVRCAVCGSFLYSVVLEGRYVHVGLGTLAQAPSLLPTAHIYVGSKAPWHEITDGLPQHDELP